jgi:hypothetical protein
LFILVAASHAPQCDCRTHRIHIGHGFGISSRDLRRMRNASVRVIGCSARASSHEAETRVCVFARVRTCAHAAARVRYVRACRKPTRGNVNFVLANITPTDSLTDAYGAYTMNTMKSDPVIPLDEDIFLRAPVRDSSRDVQHGTRPVEALSESRKTRRKGVRVVRHL